MPDNNSYCKHCGAKVIREKANFCRHCGLKLNETCPACWKKEGQENSCPGDMCPDVKNPLQIQ